MDTEYTLGENKEELNSVRFYKMTSFEFRVLAEPNVKKNELQIYN